MYSAHIEGLLPEIHAQLRSGEHLRTVAADETEEWRKQWAVNTTDVPDFSRSFQCEGLSLALFELLDAEGIPARREFHVHPYSNQWHFVVRHSLGEPSADDIITDLNPWSFAPKDKNLPDFMHGKRGDLIQAVNDAGSDVEFAARIRAECLDVSTIALSHTVKHSLVNHFVRVEGADIIQAKVAAGVVFGFSDWRTE